MTIIIKQPTTKEEFKALYALRYHVLRESLGLPKGSEKDDFEPISIHFIAVDSATGEIVGNVKLFEKSAGIGQFSHLAVAENQQGKGIGKQLVDAVENKARELNYHTIGTLTRLTATDFYQKCGYQKVGISGSLFGKLQMMWMEKKI
jgi:N-acetylglutamate synthase-like GNAT family acetyltransferase